MSITALEPIIAAARADGTISLEEARNITSPNDPTFGSPKGVGTFVDTFEHKAIKDLSADIESGAIAADPRAAYALKKFADKGADSRGKAILENLLGLTGGTMTGAVAGIGVGGAVGLFAFAELAASLAPFAGIFVWFAPAVVIGLAGAAIGAALQGALDD